eukprot:GHUV01033099.1.p1 GENE.GHUV01033099.1~~GHUV01033099.1.p1  ORF type:complete len:126 (+),score=14.65 GHUV01033099.1:253-630(+)
MTYTVQPAATGGSEREILLHSRSSTLLCSQIQRPVPRMEFVKIVKKSLNMKISPTVLDIIYYCFGDDEGNLDGPAFVDVMKRRNRVPGYKKNHGLGVEPEGSTSHQPVLNWFRCISNCTFDSDNS